MSFDDFERKPARTAAKFVLRGWMIAVLVIVLSLVTGAALWAAGVFTSDVKGRGDAQVTKYSAPNRIGANKTFEQLYADIIAADKNINVTAKALASNPSDGKLNTEYRGQVMYCNDLVAEYNSAALAFLSEEFRRAELPHQINTSNEATDCEETK
jgi:hypothetical protein